MNKKIKHINPNQINKTVKNADPHQIFQAFKDVMDAYYSYKVVHEQELTKRTEIQSEKEKYIEEIRTKKEVFLHYLNKEYASRSQIYSEFFNKLDLAFQNNNIELAHICMTGILEQAKISPFAAGIQGFRNFLEKKDEVDSF
jgi:hypothetical protein